MRHPSHRHARRCRRCQPPRAPHGFTAIEVVVVLAVVGILVGIALPRLDLRRFRLDSAAREVASTLARAQYRAVLYQHDVVVRFDVAGRRLDVHEDRNNDGLLQPDEPVTGVALPDGVVFGRGAAPARPLGPGPVSFRQRNGVPSLPYRRNGSAGEAGVLYLTVPAPQGEAPPARYTRAVEVERATGRASWFFYDGAAWRRGF